MWRIQVQYEYGETVDYDEVIVERANVRLLRGRRAVVKTGNQVAFYSKVGRILIDTDHDGPAQRFTRSAISGDERADR